VDLPDPNALFDHARHCRKENTGYKPRAKSAVVSPKMAGMEIVRNANVLSRIPLCALARSSPL